MNDQSYKAIKEKSSLQAILHAAVMSSDESPFTSWHEIIHILNITLTNIILDDLCMDADDW